MDEIEPDCANCPLPRLTDQGIKVLTAYGMLRQLEGLGIGSYILRAYEIGREDLELLAVVAATLNSKNGDMLSGPGIQGQ